MPTPTRTPTPTPQGRPCTTSTQKKMERAAPIKTFSTSDVWEQKHGGDFWMDGLSSLHPDEHPLWGGYIDAAEITPEHTSPFYRQLTLEQFNVLQSILEGSSSKNFPSKAFRKWWPCHFTLNEKAQDAKTTPTQQKWH
ncbi:hypothetical protein EMPG_16591 [Blastomyces silverae]|uniref:Uncharacterized protein n=1 Tax=Blastomyces silverae TaxID=2060906 RepID=A0A0H1B920_9EURO|nr:hypothetical protein EMPG_16591 [Blastomyces silverae]